MIPDPQTVDSVIRDVAEAEIMPRFRNLGDGDVFEKNGGDIVTTADQASEAQLVRQLSHVLAAPVVGEEGSDMEPQNLEALSRSGPVWIVDPVDGTKNFADGKPCFAVIVALVIDGRTEAGWIHEPVKDTTVWAIRGEGAWENGRRLKLDPPKNLESYHGSLAKRVRNRLEQRRAANGALIPEKMLRYGCVGAEYADLARNTLHFARYGGRLKPWDHAAGVLIHAEAGGYGVMTHSRAPYDPNGSYKGNFLLMAPGERAWTDLNDLLAD